MRDGMNVLSGTGQTYDVGYDVDERDDFCLHM